MSKYKENCKSVDNDDDDDDDIFIYNNYDDDYNNYVIKANVCTILGKELGLKPLICDTIVSYEKPKEYGLSNCDFIIPQHYIEFHNKHNPRMFEFDYYEIIKDDIKNFRKLNKYQLEYIEGISHNQKNEIIELYNKCMISIHDYFSCDNKINS